MTVKPTLGPGASLLLGMLGRPMTTDELVKHARAALELDLETIAELADAIACFPGGSPRATLERIRNGGTGEVDRLMRRLARFGFVEAVEDPFGGTLWRRLPAA